MKAWFSEPQESHQSGTSPIEEKRGALLEVPSLRDLVFKKKLLGSRLQPSRPNPMIRLMGSLTSLLWESPGGLAGHIDPTHMARGCPQHAALALESLCDTVPYALCLLSYGVRRDKKEKVRQGPRASE